ADGRALFADQQRRDRGERGGQVPRQPRRSGQARPGEPPEGGRRAEIGPSQRRNRSGGNPPAQRGAYRARQGRRTARGYLSGNSRRPTAIIQERRHGNGGKLVAAVRRRGGTVDHNAAKG